MLSRRELFPTWERSSVLLRGLWFGSVLGKGSAAQKHPSAVTLQPQHTWFDLDPGGAQGPAASSQVRTAQC